MIFRTPDYFEQFQCIADKCRHSCCIGWEIDIDEDTFEYYKLVPGAFGNRLRTHMNSGEENCFVLGEHDRCPLLNDKNLCDICIELGEEALSEVCTEYPRFTLEYGNVREKCLALSCEEAGRLVFSEDRPFAVTERELEENYFGQEDCLEEEQSEEEGSGIEEYMDEDCEFAEEEPDPELVILLENGRAHMLKLLKNRDMTLDERLEMYLDYAWKLQQEIDDGSHPGSGADSRKNKSEDKQADKSRNIEKSDLLRETRAGALDRMDVFDRLEILDEEWNQYRGRLREMLDGWDENQYQTARQRFREHLQGREYEEEAWMTYLAFRYLLKSVYDKKLEGRALFTVCCFYVVRDMDLLRFISQGDRYTVEDRIDVARIFSREVEHSEENTELILQEVMR